MTSSDVEFTKSILLLDEKEPILLTFCLPWDIYNPEQEQLQLIWKHTF